MKSRRKVVPMSHHEQLLSAQSDHSGYRKCWMLRLLVDLGGHRNWLRLNCIASDEVAREVGLSHLVDDPDYKFSRESVLAELREAHRQMEVADESVVIPKTLSENAARLGALIGLSASENRILEFLVLLNHDSLLGEVAEYVANLGGIQAYRVISVVLGIPEVDVRRAFSSKGRLSSSGVAKSESSDVYPFRFKFDLIERSFAERMMAPMEDPLSLFRDSLRQSPPPTLTIKNYAHLGGVLDILTLHLRKAVAEERKGVNALIYGPPGTGKSELSRVIAQAIQAKLYEVSCETFDGEPIEGGLRLRAFKAAQSLLKGRRSLIVFDETEDVFGYGDLPFDRPSAAKTRKGWINRALEENPVPSLWISNSVRAIDPALLRRFDLVIELEVPPKRQRVEIVQTYCKDLVDAKAVESLAESAQLSPAILARATRVVRAVKDELRPEQVGKGLLKIVNGTLSAQGKRAIDEHNAVALPSFYGTAYLNVDADLEGLAAGIEHSGSARLCLYGPPGTGKSAFGRWLSERLNRPLYAKRVSDLVSPYLGMTERNFARAFQEAAEDNAILLLDEVDSYLQDRQKANRSWEVTEVNEMLTQMEAFSGVFVASTNLIDDLDPAALRRFDLKLQFNYLKPEQAWGLYVRQSAVMGLQPPLGEHRRQLDALQSLTPGDFAAVIRQSRFKAIVDHEVFLRALAAECGMRHPVRRAPIGFVG